MRTDIKDITQDIFLSKQNTMIIISDDTNKDWFYKDSWDKLRVIPTIDFKKDRLLFAWIWKWSTDIFEIYEDWLQTIFSNLK